MTLPEGYVVESVPESMSLGMEQEIGSFSYNVVVSNNRVMVRAMLEFNYAVVTKEYYQTIKDFYQKVIEKQGEKVIIVKK
jgi:hypothetical protein